LTYYAIGLYWNLQVISARFATKSEIEHFRQYVEKSDE